MISALISLLGGGVAIPSTWLAAYGGSGTDVFYDCVLDSSGDIIAVGSTTSTGKIGTQDGIVVKIDKNGVLVWAKTYGLSAKTTTFRGVAVDSSDNIIVCGSSDEPGYGSSDGVVLKLSGADGSITWQSELGGANTDNLYSVAVDSSGNVAATGSTNNDILIAYWNSSGTLQWHRTLAQGGTESGQEVAMDSSGNVYVAGIINGTSARAILAKYNSGGTIQWKSQLAVGTDLVYGFGIAVDGSGNPHVHFINGNTNDVYVVKANSTASSITWQRKFSTSAVSGNSGAGGIRVDASGNVYSLFIPTITTRAAVIAMHNSSGTIQFQNRIRDDNVTDPVDGYGLAYLTADNYLAVVGSTTAVGAGGTDGFILHAPMGGGGTATRNTIEYEAAGLTEAAGSATIATASGATDAAGALSSGTSALSASTLSLTLTVTN